MKLKSYQADIVLVFVAISWGVTFALVQDALDSVSVYGFLFWRFLAAFLLMSLFAWRSWSRMSAGILFAAVLLGSFNFIAYAFQTYALNLTLSSTVAFITGFNVIFIPFIAFIVFRQAISLYVVLGALLALAGLWLLTGQSGLGLGLGEGYTLVCALFVALHILYTDKFVRRYDVMLLVALQFGVVALYALILGVAVDGSVIPESLSTDLMLALVVTVLFATIFAFWAQTSMQQFTTATKTALIFTMEPLSAALFGYLYIDEVLSFAQLAGGLLIVLAVIFAEVMTLRKS